MDAITNFDNPNPKHFYIIPLLKYGAVLIGADNLEEAKTIAKIHKKAHVEGEWEVIEKEEVSIENKLS
jgi:hypothetical protein